MGFYYSFYWSCYILASLTGIGASERDENNINANGTAGIVILEGPT